MIGGALMIGAALAALSPPAAPAADAWASVESPLSIGAAPRVEARSATLLAVGVVHDDKMTIHLSRLIDNAPVRDAAISVVLRGIAHPTTAEADGSYTVASKDLSLPGAATVQFEVSQADLKETLRGTLDIAAGAGQSEDRNSARQLWWWVLNFAVCIGVLMLINRRRKAAQS